MIKLNFDIDLEGLICSIEAHGHPKVLASDIEQIDLISINDELGKLIEPDEGQMYEIREACFIELENSKFDSSYLLSSEEFTG